MADLHPHRSDALADSARVAAQPDLLLDDRVTPDFVLPDESLATVQQTAASLPPAGSPPMADALAQAIATPGFDPHSTMHFQARMKHKAPVWFCSFLAGNQREKRRFRDELVMMKGAWPLLMKQRNGGTWTPEDKARLKAMVQSASSVSPYLFIWAIPGSMLLLPFLAWFLDKRRKSLSNRLPRD